MLVVAVYVSLLCGFWMYMIGSVSLQDICNNLNHRHVMAQYASRASVGLHTQLFFKSRNLLEQGYVLTVRKNALQGKSSQLLRLA